MTRSLFVLPALASATPFAKPRVLGLTGGIAAGKSTAREAFASLGVPCLDGDAVARGIHQEPTHPATQALALAFPNWMTPAGALQRGSLQGLFARDADANRTLIDILKPHVLAADGVQADALHNDESQEQLQAQVAALHQHYLQLWN